MKNSKRDTRVTLHVSCMKVKVNHSAGITEEVDGFNCHGTFAGYDYEATYLDKEVGIQHMTRKAQEKCGQQVIITINDHTITPDL